MKSFIILIVLTMHLGIAHASASSSSSAATKIAANDNKTTAENLVRVFSKPMNSLRITVFNGKEMTFGQAYNQCLSSVHKAAVYEAALNALDASLKADLNAQFDTFLKIFLELKSTFKSEKLIAKTHAILRQKFNNTHSNLIANAKKAKRLAKESCAQWKLLRSSERLLAAACDSDTQEAEALLNQGADPNFTDCGTPLLYAVTNSQEAIIKLLIEHGVDFTRYKNPITQYIKECKFKFKPEFLKYLAEQEKKQSRISKRRPAPIKTSK